MVKGCKRQVVVIRNPESAYIEEAYFILRDGVERCSNAGLLAEADRILQTHRLPESSKTEGKHLGSLGWFAAGSATMFGSLTLLFALL